MRGAGGEQDHRLPLLFLPLQGKVAPAPGPVPEGVFFHMEGGVGRSPTGASLHRNDAPLPPGRGIFPAGVGERIRKRRPVGDPSSW